MNFTEFTEKSNLTMDIEPFNIVAKILDKNNEGDSKDPYNTSYVPPRVVEMKVYVKGYDITETLNEVFLDKFETEVLKKYNN